LQVRSALCTSIFAPYRPAAMGAACCASEPETAQTLAVENYSPLAENPSQAKALEKKHDSPKLTVTIVGARGLRNADWAPGTGKSDPYCILKVKGTEVLRTKTVNDCLEPIWMEEVLLPDYVDGEPLEFTMYDQDVGKSDFLGKVSVASSIFSESGFYGDLKIEEAGVDQAYLKLKIKVAGREYPPAPPSEVRMIVEKQSGTIFGLDLDTQDNATLFVLEIREGAFKTYNDGATVEEQIRPMDFITSINGVTGSAGQMLEQFRIQDRVALVVRRPQEYIAMVDASDSKRHGLTFPAQPVGRHLVITGVGEGGASDWNRSQPEDRRIRPGDRIVSVGGRLGKSLELRRMLEKGGLQQYLLVRPGTDGVLRWAR